MTQEQLDALKEWVRAEIREFIGRERMSEKMMLREICSAASYDLLDLEAQCDTAECAMDKAFLSCEGDTE
jgi:hypothetical protein